MKRIQNLDTDLETSLKEANDMRVVARPSFGVTRSARQNLSSERRGSACAATPIMKLEVTR